MFDGTEQSGGLELARTTVGDIPAVVQGASAGEPQSRRARERGARAATSGAVAQTRNGRPERRVDTDVAEPPQTFSRRPSIDAVSRGVAGTESLPFLPGRMPPPGWDGEPGPTAPTAQL